MKTFLLVDTSYSVFYRFFATKRWYSFSNPEDKFPEDYNWDENELFKNMYIKKYLSSFDDIIKKYTIDKDNILFVKDCPRKDIWRNEFFKDYKSGRTKTNSIGNFFKDTYTLIKENCYKLIEYDKLEADDCIYFTKQYLRKTYPNSKIIVITSDEDMLQLIDNNTFLFNLKNKCLNTKSTGDPKLDLELKIICGDKSDNICPCFKRCGKKTATKLYNNKSLLLDKFKEFPDSLEKYSLDRMLIDFNNIPSKFIEPFNTYLLSLNL